MQDLKKEGVQGLAHKSFLANLGDFLKNLALKGVGVRPLRPPPPLDPRLTIGDNLFRITSWGNYYTAHCLLCGAHTYSIIALYATLEYFFFYLKSSYWKDVSPWRHPDANTTRRTAKDWFSN